MSSTQHRPDRQHHGVIWIGLDGGRRKLKAAALEDPPPDRVRVLGRWGVTEHPASLPLFERSFELITNVDLDVASLLVLSEGSFQALSGVRCSRGRTLPANRIEGDRVPEDHWQPARLIPTSGINGQEEAERRATSALLAVVGSVKEFGAAIVKPLGAPAGHIATFIEVPFKNGEHTVYPDGVIQTGRAGRAWTCLVEIKTGSAELECAQIENYLDVARDNGFDVVLTISNQMAPAPGVHPVDVDKKKLRKVELHHLSWPEVMTVAIQQRVHHGISDPDQAWILGELIRYLEHPKSGASDFSDMGAAWVPVRDALLAGTLRANDKGLAQVVSRWEQLLRFAALRLSRELGAEVQVVTSRKEGSDPGVLLAAQAQSLLTTGTLTGALKIPDAVGPMDLVVDLRVGRVTVYVDVDAPRQGRPSTRVTWLVRQLKDAPDGLRIDAHAVGSRSTTSELLRIVRERPEALIEDPKRDLRTFRITASSPLGTKRGTGRGGFIDSVLAAIDGFYEAVVQHVRPWTTHAPQLPKGGKTAAEAAGLDLAPPPGDLLEDIEPEVVGQPDAPLPEGLSVAVELAAHGILDADAEPASLDAGQPHDKAAEDNDEVGRDPVDSPADPWVEGAPAPVGPVTEMVSWEVAQARLDQERSLEEVDGS